jgi:hypothetical protein
MSKMDANLRLTTVGADRLPGKVEYIRIKGNVKDRFYLGDA